MQMISNSSSIQALIAMSLILISPGAALVPGASSKFLCNKQLNACQAKGMPMDPIGVLVGSVE